MTRYPSIRRPFLERTEIAARRVMRRMRERSEQRFRPNLSDRQLGEPTVYFLAPDVDQPFGGTRVLYRHADILRAAGLNAVVLHRRNGFRYKWFDNDTVVRSVGECVIGPDDLLVVSELDVFLLARNYPHPGRCPRHIVLNQSGPYLTWQRDPAVLYAHYTSPNRPLGIIATSAYIADFARFAFPHIGVCHVRLSLDPSRFFPALVEPPRRIVFMQRDIPEKGSDDAETVLRVLTDRGVLRGWETVVISGLTENGVAATLRSSKIFLAVSVREGFGLPPLEAMASGCYVVGYHANGGREYMGENFSRTVEAGNVLELAEALEQAIARESEQPGWLRSRGLAASEYVHSHYCPAVEKADVIAAYSEFI